MSVNPYFQSGNTSGTTGEQRLVEDLVVESLKIYGHDVFYMPRTSVNQDMLYGEDPLSKFTQAYSLEMYLTEVQGWGGQGELLSKFGVTVNNEVTFIVSKRRWEESVSGVTDDIQLIKRPAEGDLIYIPKTKAFFEITYVDHLTPFFQLDKFYVYTLSCKLFRYASEVINTGIGDIDVRGDRSTDVLDNVLMDFEGNTLTDVGGFPLGYIDVEDQLHPLDDRKNIKDRANEFVDFEIENPFGSF